MVLTRSGRSSPRKPPTPGRKRKTRLKHADESSSDEEGTTIELSDVRKSLAENLGTINEENEETEMDENENDLKCLSVKLIDTKRKWSPAQSNRSITQMKTPLKTLDTISEEGGSECRDDNKMVVGEPLNDGLNVDEAQCSNTTMNKPESSTSFTKLKKNRFYFPPAKTLVPPNIMPTSIDVGMETQDIYIDMKSAREGKKKIESLFAEVTVNKKDSQLKDSVITPDFETKLAIPAQKSLQQQRKERKELKESSAGKEWFNMKPPEMTNDVKRDLEILQMRSVLDPKRFYKHNDRKTIPRYFQIGKVMDSPADFYSSRVPKKQRKANLTEELLADAQFQKYQKRKYNEIQMKKKALGAKQRRTKRGKFSKRNKETI